MSTSNSSASLVSEIDFSHYRPTPDSRRFSISTFAVTGQISWEAKPAGEFAARIDVLKGALAKMIPFKTMEASVKISNGVKTYLVRSNAELKEKSWSDLSVISPIEIPWVAEYALSRWSVGGPQETYFSFEDNQRVRRAVLFFREGSDASGSGDAMAVLRVVKPDEGVRSIAETQSSPKPGDVLITFRDFRITGVTVNVPIVGKLQFVAV